MISPTPILLRQSLCRSRENRPSLPPRRESSLGIKKDFRAPMRAFAGMAKIGNGLSRGRE
jgi:hypothetical protein